MTRVLVCLLLFGLGAQALGGGPIALIISGAIALYVSWRWKQVKAEEHRRQVVADEQLRLDVLHRREREGRTP